MKTRHLKWAMFALFCLCATACAGMTAAETTGVIAAGTGVLTALSEAIVPYLPPEKQVEVVNAMNSAQGLMNAVTTAMGSVAQAAQQAQQQASEGVTATELVGGTVVAGGGATIASRVLSAFKHGTPGKKQQAG